MPVNNPSRPQPPSITDPERGEAKLDYLGRDDDSPGGYVPDETGEESSIDWAKRAQDAFEFSTSYLDSNYRKQWEDSLRAFSNRHPGDSKYNSELWAKRSRIFRPKTRAVIRKNEAAAAAAFFSNVDRISVEAQNEADQAQRLSAAIMKELLQFRLTKSVPWFQTVVGGLQDAQVQGVCSAHVYWQFVTRKGKDDVEIVEDRPCVDLIPIENLRFDGAASWIDPINTSPYVIHLIPMYVVDVKARMARPDPKGRTWQRYSDAVLGSFKADDDSTRQARIGAAQDPTTQRRGISDYDIVWVHRHIHRHQGKDWEFYTLASQKMLTEPEPLTETVFHGLRPYVLGNAILETHKPMPSSLPKLVEGPQEEANEIANQRLDNVKFVMNKRWIAKRGKNIDLASLVRNVPGGVTLADDPENDIKEITWPDVTSSAYQEQDRIDADFSDLAGNFDPMQIQASRLGQSSTNTMRLLQGPSNLLTEYMLKTFVETFVQPVLRQIVLLEQHYETDATVLGIAGQRAQAFQKFGKDTITDDMLDHELTVIVNVGMGATDPVLKLQRFVAGLQALQQISLKPPPGLNLQEIGKEIFGLSGYQDGTRFYIDDPDKMSMAKQIQEMTAKLRELLMNQKIKADSNPTRLEIAKLNNETKLAIAGKSQEFEGRKLLANHLMTMEQGKHQAGLQQQSSEHDAQLEAQKPSPAAEPKQDTSGVEKQINELAKGQEALAKAISEIHQHMKESKPSAPKKRVGKAKLPSGGEMTFEYSDEVH